MSPRSAQYLLTTLITFLLLSCSRQDPLAESQKLIQQFDYAGARKILERVIAKDSTNVDAMAMLLRVLWLQRDTNALENHIVLASGSELPNWKLSLLEYYQYRRLYQQADSLSLQLHKLGPSHKLSRKLVILDEKREAGRLLRSATNFINRGIFDSALVVSDSALTIYTKHGDEMGVASSLLALSFANSSQGRLPESQTQIEKAYIVALRTGERGLLSRVLNIWAVILDREGKRRQALEKMAEAVEYARADQNTGFLLGGLINLASMQLRDGDMNSAITTNREILSLSKEYQYPTYITYALMNLGDVYKHRGNLDSAATFFHEALSLAEQRQDFLSAAFALDALAQISTKRGSYDDAISRQRRANILFEKVGDRYNEGQGKRHMAEIYHAVGNYEAARLLAKESMVLGEEIGSSDLTMMAQFTTARIYKALGDFKTASKLLASSITSAYKADWLEVLTMSVAELADCFEELSPPESIVSQAESLLVVAGQRGYKLLEISLKICLSNFYLSQNRLDKAASLLLYPDSLEAFPELVHEAYKTRALFYLKQGRSEDAMRAFGKMQKYEDIMFRRMMTYADRATFLDKMRRNSEQRIRLGYDMNHYDSVFTLAERAKAAAFASLLLARSNAISPRNESLLLEKDRGFRMRIANALSFSREQYLKAPSEFSLRSVEHQSHILQQASAAYSQFLYEQEIENPRLSSIISIPRITAQDIRPLIPKDAILLDYIVLDEKVLVCTLKREGELKVFGMPMTRQKVRDDVATLRIKMSKKFVGETGWKKLAEQFERVLLDSVKVSGLLAGINRLIIVPDDVLYYLPFQLLSNGKQSLAERFTIVNYPSAGVMKLMKQLNAQPSARTSMLAMAYSDGSIPFAEAEVKAISADLGAGVTAIVGKSATRDTLRRLAERYDVFHFAMHGVPYPKDPLLGALQFAPTKDDDGKLYVHEVFNLKLKNALVVLNGCETGVDRAYQRGISPGGEVIGLTRAFLYAGASGVVSTLWKVDDKASMEFMRKYYKHLQKTADIADALALAQREFSSDPQYRHPYYWAAYVVTGF
jgi:CHAT domain-containing protein